MSVANNPLCSTRSHRLTYNLSNTFIYSSTVSHTTPNTHTHMHTGTHARTHTHTHTSRFLLTRHTPTPPYHLKVPSQGRSRLLADGVIIFPHISHINPATRHPTANRTTARMLKDTHATLSSDRRRRRSIVRPHLPGQTFPLRQIREPPACTRACRVCS